MAANNTKKPARLFELGAIVATPGALALLDASAIDAVQLLERHQTGDWGAVPPEDAHENGIAIEKRLRILSSYEINASKERIWIITEADRSATTLLLPEEY